MYKENNWEFTDPRKTNENAVNVIQGTRIPFQDSCQIESHRARQCITRKTLSKGPEIPLCKAMEMNPRCTGDPKMMEEPEAWDICQRNQHTRSRTSLTENVCCNKQSWKGRAIETLWHWTWSYRIWHLSTGFWSCYCSHLLCSHRLKWG